MTKLFNKERTLAFQKLIIEMIFLSFTMILSTGLGCCNTFLMKDSLAGEESVFYSFTNNVVTLES